MRVRWGDGKVPNSAYQTSAYGRAVAHSTKTMWDVISSEDGRWRIPLCLATIDEQHVDAVSPYGYPGIHVDPDLTSAEIDDAWAQTLGALIERNVVSVFFRFTPYSPGIELNHALPGLEVRHVSDTIIVPITDESLMWAAMQGRSRTAVRKAEREQLSASVAPARFDELSGDMSGFRRVYDVAMDRVHASPVHRHSDEYYRILTSAAELDVQLVSVKDANGEVVAACLLLVDEDAVHYQLSGSQASAARLGANNLLIWSAMRWAFENRHARLHLGGGTARDDSLFRFKVSFGGLVAPFRVGRLVVDADAYERLVEIRAVEHGTTREVILSSNHFPAYRAPIS